MIEWREIFAVDAATDPQLAGTVYRLRYADGSTRELWETDDRYSELAHIIDSVHEEGEP